MIALTFTFYVKGQWLIGRVTGILAPEGDPADQIEEFSGKKCRCLTVIERHVRQKRPGDQHGQGDCDFVGHGGTLEAAHRGGHIRHADREAPFIVIPGQNAHGTLADDLGLVGGKDR